MRLQESEKCNSFLWKKCIEIGVSLVIVGKRFMYHTCIYDINACYRTIWEKGVKIQRVPQGAMLWDGMAIEIAFSKYAMSKMVFVWNQS